LQARSRRRFPQAVQRLVFYAIGKPWTSIRREMDTRALLRSTFWTRMELWTAHLVAVHWQPAGLR